MRELEDLLEAWVRLLVASAPERVRVRAQGRGSEHLVRLLISVAPEDRGYIVGKGGRTIEALRIVAEAVARRRGLHCRIEDVE